MNILRRTLLIALTACVALSGVAFTGVTSAAADPGPQLTGTTLTLSNTSIYPHVDGYRDSLGISIAKHVTGASGSVPLSGRISLARKGRTVSSYPITTSTTETFSWNGRVNGKVVAGNYSVTARVTGPNGTITKSAVVSVSHARLVPHTSVVTVSAQEFFQHGYTALSNGRGCIEADGGTLSCVSYHGAPALGGNYVTVPARVLAYAGYQPYSAKVSVTLSRASVVKGTDDYWEWNGSHHFAFGSAGTHTTGSSTFGANQNTQLVSFRVGGGTAATISQVSIAYTYAILA